MYDFFKNIAEKNSCTLMGACSIHPSVNALYQIILNEIREISSYLVKLKEFKIKDQEASNIALDGLSIFLINTSYNQNNYLDFVKNLYLNKKRVKEKYIDYCEKNSLPCELIKNSFEFQEKQTISELIEYAQNNFINIQKNTDKTKLRLYELITLFSRLCAIEVTKIKKLEEKYDDFNFEILRFFALTNSYSIRNEKIIRRIYEFSDFSLKIAIKLSEIYQKRYGAKENASTKSSLLNGHCILASGDDLDELEKLLKTIENCDIKETINVYTHGSLFLAHFYPYFKKNKYLKGHFGSDSAEYDFSRFDGAILITQNFIQKIDSLYRGEIFSNKLISFSKVSDIKNQNYMPVIECALGLEKCKEAKESTSIKINYNRKKIEKFIEEANVEEIIVISGLLDSEQEISDYNDKKVITLSSPLEGDILLDSISKLKEKNIKITIFLAQCNLINLNLLLMLLNQQVDLNITNCPHALINPHVIESLKEDFKVKII
ncbi:MAG: hypothetical protein IJB79_03700 [Candidatus Gastranaerophilales bacterium]|nr:hypothetical protein [Candidatus Gastranaerophilales bacterium]